MTNVRRFLVLMGMCLAGCVDPGPSRELTGGELEVARHGLGEALRSARVADLDVGGLTRAAPGDRVTLALPDEGPTELVIRTVQHLVPGVTTFTGHLADDELSDFTLSIEGGKLVGAIHQGTTAWLVAPHPRTAQHVVRTIDRSRLRHDEPNLPAHAVQRRAQTPDDPREPEVLTAAHGTGDVRVLFLHANNVGNASSQAANIVAAFNQSLSLSDVAPNNYLVSAGVQQVASDFNDQSRTTIVNAMVGRTGVFTGVDALITSTAADVVFLLVSEDLQAVDVGAFGRVGGATPVVVGATHPFTMSTESYALGDRTALHELGHVFGGAHESKTFNEAGIARGMIFNAQLMTVMGGYDNVCQFAGLGAACVRLNRWTNPDQTYMGMPLGVAGQRDMESHLEGAMPAASAWRPDPAPATMISPTPGSTLPGSSVTFSWTAGSGVAQYYLHIGTSAGGADLYQASQNQATSGTVNGLPIAGQPIYVRLWSLIDGNWQFRDYTYTAASGGVPAVMQSPTPGSALPGSSVTFSWSTGVGVAQYYLYVGTSAGGADLYHGSQGLATSGTVHGLPTAGQPIHVRLWSLINGGWQWNDYAYTAATVGVPAVMLSPTPGSILPGANVTFAWSTGANVSHYYLFIGSFPGGTDYYGASQGLATSTTVYGLPTDGRTLHVRLWSLTNVGWQLNDYVYTAATPVCHPLWNTHGQTWTVVNAQSQWVYNQGWCTVGHGLPEGCWQGTYYYYQHLQSYYCSSVGSSGSCYDGDAWWAVTCDALVDCIYDCQGNCVQAVCNG